MPYYLSEDKMKALRSGSLEEQIFEIHALLKEHHASEPPVKRKVLATFGDGAVVAEDSGAVYRYVCGFAEERYQVVTRHLLEDYPLVSESELPDEIARAVVEGRPMPTGFKQPDDLAPIIWERIGSLLDQSEFLDWFNQNLHVIESQQWGRGSAEHNYASEHAFQRIMMRTQGKSSKFTSEWTTLAYWVSKLPPNSLEKTKGGGCGAALVEYIKKIDTFTHLKFGPVVP